LKVLMDVFVQVDLLMLTECVNRMSLMTVLLQRLLMQVAHVYVPLIRLTSEEFAKLNVQLRM
jgi:hypothetical protein